MPIGKKQTPQEAAGGGDAALSHRQRYAMAAITGLVAVDSWIELKRAQLAGSGYGMPSLPPVEKHAKRAWEIADAMMATEGGQQ